MTGLDVVRDLHPPRLPEAFAALGWPELLAAFGLGLLLALGIHAVLRPVLTRRARTALEPHLARLRALPPQERLLAQARLLTRLGGTVPAEIRPLLYAPDPGDPRLEPLIREAFRRADLRQRALADV